MREGWKRQRARGLQGETARQGRARGYVVQYTCELTKREEDGRSQKGEKRAGTRWRETEAVVVVCRGLAVPPFRPLSSLEEGVGERTGVAKLCEECAISEQSMRWSRG